MAATAQIQSVAAPIPPWLAADAFPQRPAEGEYGFMAGGRLRTCSQEELIKRCSRDEVPAIHLVWTPDTPRLVPPAEVPFLFAAVKNSAMRRCVIAAVMALPNVLVWGLLAYTSWKTNAAISRFFLLNGLFWGLLPLIDGVVQRWQLRGFSPEHLAREAASCRYAAWLATRSIVLTWILCGCIVLIAVAQMAVGLPKSIEAAGLVKQAVWKGQAWRLLTAPMLHAGIFHIVFNGCALLGLGRMMEVTANRFSLAIVFLVSALGGSVCSLLFLPQATSVGASGGLLGLIGFLAVLGYRRRQQLPPGFLRAMTINILLIAAVGAVAYDVIDNAAHGGGLLCGICLGWLMIGRLGRLPLDASLRIRRLGAICAATLFTIAAATLWIIAVA